MAGDDLLGTATQTLTGGLDSLGSSVYWIVLGLLVVVIIALVVYIMSFKHLVVVRYRTGNRKFIIMDKARQVERQGVPYWKLLKMKKEVTCPPPEAIDITKKGKFIAECYWSSDNPEPIWMKDNAQIDEKLLQPFSTQERAVHVARVTRAMMRKKGTILETIEKLAVPFAVVVILIVMLIFWEDIAKPAREMAQANKELAVENAKISEQNARILSVLAGKLEADEIGIIQNVAPPEVTS